jgi:hypothetical protein
VCGPPAGHLVRPFPGKSLRTGSTLQCGAAAIEIAGRCVPQHPLVISAPDSGSGLARLSSHFVAPSAGYQQERIDLAEGSLMSCSPLSPCFGHPYLYDVEFAKEMERHHLRRDRWYCLNGHEVFDPPPVPVSSSQEPNGWRRGWCDVHNEPRVCELCSERMRRVRQFRSARRRTPVAMADHAAA